MAKDVALIVGVGPGLGEALARRFAKGGFRVAVAARRQEAIAGLARDIDGRAYAADATLEGEVDRLFASVQADLGAPSVAIYNAGVSGPGGIFDLSTADFERSWRIGCLGGFLTGQRAARLMVEAGKGTILFTGATGSLRGSPGWLKLTVGKFGLRALAQSMARELGPKGIHVAHVIIDGHILGERYTAMAKERPADALLRPDDIAETYWQLHAQPRSAWTFELDLRPWVEKF